MFSSLKRALKINDLDFFNLNTPNLPSFNFDQFKHHGLPPRPTSVSFDPLGLLVVGTEDGVLKINGETVSGSETTLVSEQKDRIIFAEIISDKGYAVAVTEQSVELWNVNTRQLVSRKTLQPVTCVSSTAPHKSATSLHFIYIGDDRGNVYLIKFSETDIFVSQALNFDEKKHRVSGLAVNPKREEELLVAFNSGRVIICNMRTKEIAFEYDFSLSEKYCAGSISYVCWLPSGHQFVCGYTNGLIATSSKKREGSSESDPMKPKKLFSVNDNLEDSKSRTPVRKICSGTTKAGYFLVILGGSWVGESKCELFLLAKTKHKIGSSKHYSTSTLCGTSSECTIKDFALFNTSNSESSVVIATNNGLSVLQLETTNKLADEVFCTRGVFLLQTDPAYKFVSVDSIPQSAIVNFASSMKTKTTSSKWPITGGRDPKLPVPDDPKLMISCHESGVLRFWMSGRNLDFWECIEETNLNVNNNVTVSTIIQSSDGSFVKQQSFSQVTERIVTHLQVVDAGDLFVFIGCLNGDTVLLKYCTDKQSEAPFLIEMPTDVSHGQSTNAFLPCSEKVPSVGCWDNQLHGQATERQIGVIRFSKPIQFIQATNSLCAIADCDGYLALFGWSNRQFQFKAAFTSTQPLASLLFAWIAVSQLSTVQAQTTQRKSALICTLQNGSCYALVLADNTILPISTETKKSKIELSVCVDQTGRDISSTMNHQQCFQKASENNFIIPEDISSQLPTLALVIASQTEITVTILEYPQFKKIKIDLKAPVQHAGLLFFETEKQEPSCYLFVIQSEPQTTMTLLNWDGSVLCKKEFIGCRLFAHDKILTYKDGSVAFLLSNASVMTTNIFASSNCDRIGCSLEQMSAKPRKNSDSKSFFQQLKKLTSNTEENQTAVDYDSYFPENSNSVGNLKAETQSTENVMAKNLQALQERGEKLRNLEDKSADMANAAKDFLEMAKELKKSQQKPWYAL